MAQPTPYKRSFSFKDEEAANPTTKTPGDKLDGEFSSVQRTLSEFSTKIKLVQRDDGALANRSVGVDQLKAEVLIGVNPPSTWITAKNYIVRDTVFRDQKFWICEVSHVSGVFLTDQSAGKWTQIADFTAAQDAVLVVYDNTASGIAAENLQAAVDEIAGSINVSSVFGRAGAVVAQSGDYNSAQVTHGGGNVASWIAAMEITVAGKAASAHGHTIGEVVDLASELALKVPATRQVLTSGLAGGGGDLSAARTIDVPVATKAEAEAGTVNTKAITPLRVKEALDALTVGRGQTWQDVSGARVFGTNYQNGENSPIQVAVSVFFNATPSYYVLEVGVTTGAMLVVGGAQTNDTGHIGSMSGVVPAGHYYRVRKVLGGATAPANSWAELR